MFDWEIRRQSLIFVWEARMQRIPGKSPARCAHPDLTTPHLLRASRDLLARTLVAIQQPANAADILPASAYVPPDTELTWVRTYDPKYQGIDFHSPPPGPPIPAQPVADTLDDLLRALAPPTALNQPGHAVAGGPSGSLSALAPPSTPPAACIGQPVVRAALGGRASRQQAETVEVVRRLLVPYDVHPGLPAL